MCLALLCIALVLRNCSWLSVGCRVKSGKALERMERESD